MTNSVIPYSFVPGTKAKAAEVNANFNAIVELVEQTKELINNTNTTVSKLSTDLSEELSEKADKNNTPLEYFVTEENTDLNDYKTKGIYLFSDDVTPLNRPSGVGGVLIVSGDSSKFIKQIWIPKSHYSGICSRHYENSDWQYWSDMIMSFWPYNPGYIKFPNGFIMQFGGIESKTVVFPIAFNSLFNIVFQKSGYGESFQRSDIGILQESNTGFTMDTAGMFYGLRWIAVGF